MFLNRIFGQMDRPFGPTGLDASAPTYPPLNVWEDAEHYYVEAEAPGLNLDDFQLSVSDGDQLTIAGVRIPGGPQQGEWLRLECGYGEFARVVTLPTAVDPDGVEARYDAGVLTLTLPKSQAAKPRRITVKAGESTPALAAS